MDKQAIFKDFASVMEAEVLDPSQMDSIEAGASTCGAGCKKSCKPGNQNTFTEINLPPGTSADDINDLR